MRLVVSRFTIEMSGDWFPPIRTFFFYSDSFFSLFSSFQRTKDWRRLNGDIIIWRREREQKKKKKRERNRNRWTIGYFNIGIREIQSITFRIFICIHIDPLTFIYKDIAMLRLTVHACISLSLVKRIKRSKTSHNEIYIHIIINHSW